MDQLPIIFIAGSALVLLSVQALVLVNLWRQQRRILMRLDGLETSLTGRVSEPAIRPRAARARPAVPAKALEKKSSNGGVPVSARPTVRVGLGDQMPALDLRDFNDKPIALSDFHGNNTLLLFWNPSCGFCKAMLATLQAWDAHRAAGEPMLLVVSTGTPQENRVMNLRSPVVSDEDGDVSAMFAVNKTPMGLLIDSDGRIASNLAGGSQAIMALARSTLAQGAEIQQ